MNSTTKPSSKQRPVVFLMGPTAAGKTAAAMSLCDRNSQATLISVDSAMIYRGLDIGSAKPSQTELKSYPHELINIRSVVESYSAAEFNTDATQLIHTAHENDRIPVLVGGTMLYFKILLQGISDLPASDSVIRKQIENDTQNNGLAWLFDQLRIIDPETAARLHSNDKQRIQRALEVHAISGKPLSYWYSKEYFGENWDKHALSQSAFSILPIALAPPQKSQLHPRIEQRFHQMIAYGFLEEVEELMQIAGVTAHLPAMRCVGYRQAWQYLSGAIDAKVFEEQMLAATRQLAKRQMTWLRSWSQLNWVDPFATDHNDQIAQLLSQHLNKH